MWQLLYVIFIIGYVHGRIRLDPLVNTNQGLIKGLKADNGDYSMFLGIPYGKVNASNPFGAASPHPKFDNLFEAYDDSVICPQVEEYENTVSDFNCLNLNIFVPNKASFNNKLPVLVWIYGGGFTFGFASRIIYGPSFLVKHDVVLVTVNYRVGPYGFFCLDIPEVPGNQGLKDQLLALRWIKDNIAAFGGDDNKITIMGESAGAASVESHIYSKQEKLFQKAIMQSGSIAAPWAMLPPDRTAPLKIAEKLGFATDDVYEALSFLSNTDVKLVIGASLDSSLRYKACVEKEFDGIEQFITEHPEISAMPKAKNIPILAGFNSHEDLRHFANAGPEIYKTINFYDNLTKIFDFEDGPQEMGDILRHFYIGDKKMSVDVKSELVKYSSDLNFNYPAQRSVQKLLSNGASNIFYYVFAYSGGRNYFKRRNNVTEYGAVHADEIGYLFDVSIEKDKPSAEDQLVIDMITTLWTNFVKYGDPTPATTELLPVKWLPIKSDQLHYLEINSELVAGSRPYNERFAFWDLLFKANENNMKYRPSQK